jgi:glycosyltransferase involved in cell wall biosynthesis
VRLGLYIPLLDDRPAGVGVYIEEVCRRLVALNPDVIVYTGSPAARRAWIDPSRVRTFPRSGAPLVDVLEGARRRARRLRWLAGGVERSLLADGVDVLFSPVQEGPLVGAVPSVVVMHDLTALRYPEAYGRATVAQTRWLLPRMLRRCARVVAVSDSTRRDLGELLHLPDERVEVIGEGFDRDVFRPRTQAEVVAVTARHGLVGRYLLYAGTFSRHKNLGVLARVLARLPADVSLVLVGRKDAGAFAEFEHEAGRAGTRSRVLTPGYVTRDELAVLMSGASAFVYPSRYEGFGLAPLEAMACGAPVVASKVASLPEVVGAGGRLVDAPSDEAWARALADTLSADREALSPLAVAQAARFDWDDAARRLLAVLESVLSPGVRP